MGRTSTKETGPRKIRVYMVELKVDMPNTPNITFFGSKKAIFEYFGEKALHISYASFRANRTRFNKDRPYENPVCRIVEGYVLTDKCPEIIERRARESREEIKVSGGGLSKVWEAQKANKSEE